MTMQGWRIEVRSDLTWSVGRPWWPDVEATKTLPSGIDMCPARYALTPQRLDANGTSRDHVIAAVWFLRDTIYVSRPVTDREADTLRELLDAEMRREREARGIHYRDGSAPLVMWTAPLKSFTISPGFDAIEAGQAVTLAPDGTVRPVVTWTAPTVRATEAERAQVKAALKQLSSEWCAPIRCEPPAPRVPQVGDEIEVLSNSWHRAEVTAVGGGETFRADWVNADGDPCALWVSFARTDRWRWPETQPLTGRPTPSAGDEIEVRSAALCLEDWTRVEVSGYGNSRDEYLFDLPWPIRHGSVRREHEGVYWRWPAETHS